MNYGLCGIAWYLESKKGVVTDDMLWVARNRQWSKDSLMGQPMKNRVYTEIYIKCADNSANWNILVTEGKESNSDFLNSGELKENSLNLNASERFRCCGSSYYITRRITNLLITKSEKVLNPVGVCRYVIKGHTRVVQSTCNSVWICEAHLVRLNTPKWPIVN